ncbi:uncharacterized protein LOC124662816 [Lolium rigidum]|uniref:uncharacterized protein LOC124662816 n=1 Tax=Lolium rigidum TaxID=89674 RepID=UPI001F5DE0AE|nr:uncharacterized protein LOC124662816 [Lolium rigidum]
MADAMSEGGEEMASLPVTDDLLAEIFLRLPTAADLIRASAVCVSFGRLITTRSFIRCFRKLHVPPLLGFIDEEQIFHPAAPPHPSAAAASATALVADFSCSFLPTPARARVWVHRDSRDGRILLDTDEAAVFKEMAVCDPLHRRYLLLPPIPDDLAASVEDPLAVEAFLVPPSDEEQEAAEETSFRVIWMGQCTTKALTFVFSSNTGQWRAISPVCWNDLFPSLVPSEDTLFHFRQYAYGCFYWTSDSDAETDMLVLDTRRMEFSVAQPPEEAKSSYGLAMAMVEAGENRPGMFTVTSDTYALSYCIRRNKDGSLTQWDKNKTIPQGPGRFLIGSVPGYLLLYNYGRGFYTLDVKTFKLEKICQAILYFFLNLHSYSNFPPSFLSWPTISTGKFSFTS